LGKTNNEGMNMPVHDEKVGGRGPDEADQYVPVLYAHSVEEAERYCQLLEDHDIPAIVDDDYEDVESFHSAGVRQGVPVLAPGSFREEAQALIASLEEMGELVDEVGEPLDEGSDRGGDSDLSDDYDYEDEDEGLGELEGADQVSGYGEDEED